MRLWISSRGVIEIGELVMSWRTQVSAFGLYNQGVKATRPTLAGSRRENIGEELKTQSRTP